MPPPWYEDAAVDLRRLGLPAITRLWPRAKRATVEARSAATAFVAVLTSDTPRPLVIPRDNGGLQLEWHTPVADIELYYDPDGTLKGLCWERMQEGQPSPDWARGLLARALQTVR